MTKRELESVRREVILALRRETSFQILEIGPDAPSRSIPHVADVLLRGTVSRYDARHGGVAGAFDPAAVCFALELSGPDEAAIWRGSYCEEQKSVFRRPSSLPRAIQRGLRWVEAEELAAYGAGRLARALARAGFSPEPSPAPTSARPGSRVPTG